MTTKQLSILIGGILPALLFGVAAVFQKSSNQAGIGIGLYLIFIGIGVVAAGAGLLMATSDFNVNFRSGMYSIAIGMFWGLAMALVGYALAKYAAPLSQLVPLYNMNSLVAVIIALVVFSEWRDVSVTQLVAGAGFVILGGVLVARA